MLFTPLHLRSVQLKNRIAVSPMCQYSSVDGFANDWHLVHLGSRAVGGAGLLLTEATAVSPEGRITPDDLGIWKDEHVDMLRRICAFVDQQGCVPGIQLAHAGRKASMTNPWKGNRPLTSAEGAWTTVSVGNTPFREGYPLPVLLDKSGIDKVVADFAVATRHALQAGFKVVEIHAAHGYLLHQFYSPLTNHRTDVYGGSFDNRIRLLLEVTDAVRSEWPAELPLMVRISATDWTDGGWTADDSIQLAKLLGQHGVDLIDCSTGGNVPAVRIPVGPGYQVSFAERIKQATGMKTGAVGMITTPDQCEDIVTTGKADLVLLARQLLRDPHFPLYAAHQLKHDVDWPVQYERAKW